MTPKEKDDLITLIVHAHRDIGYQEGGTYADQNDFEKPDKKAIAAAERAIDYIKRLIMTS